MTNSWTGKLPSSVTQGRIVGEKWNKQRGGRERKFTSYLLSDSRTNTVNLRPICQFTQNAARGAIFPRYAAFFISFRPNYPPLGLRGWKIAWNSETMAKAPKQRPDNLEWGGCVLSCRKRKISRWIRKQVPVDRDIRSSRSDWARGACPRSY